MIAEALGMTKGALYKHYKNKQDIFDCIVERMYQIDNKRAKEYQVPESTIVVTPNAYRNTTIESLTTFTFAQYDFWVTDEFASNFRKMLILEQYRNLKMNMLYQKCLVNGPISYIEDIFNEMIKKGVHMTLYTITDWMGLVPIVVCLIFAGIGLVGFSVFAVLFLAMVREPYAIVVAFLLLLAKGGLLYKQTKAG